MLSSSIARTVLTSVLSALLVLPAAAQTQPSRSGSVVVAAFCCAFTFTMSNGTKNGAQVSVSRRYDGVERTLCSKWLPAGGTTTCELPADTYYDLSASVKENGNVSKQIAYADARYWLGKGSKCSLYINGRGQYSW